MFLLLLSREKSALHNVIDGIWRCSIKQTVSSCCCCCNTKLALSRLPPGSFSQLLGLIFARAPHSCQTLETWSRHFVLPWSWCEPCSNTHMRRRTRNMQFLEWSCNFLRCLDNDKETRNNASPIYMLATSVPQLIYDHGCPMSKKSDCIRFYTSPI
jgi:hypothetical protein